jgi:hypothetical protein
MIDCRRADQDAVAGPPDLAHPAFAELLFERVLAELVGFAHSPAKIVQSARRNRARPDHRDQEKRLKDCGDGDGRWAGRPGPAASNASSESHMIAVTGKTASVVRRSVRLAFDGTMIERASFCHPVLPLDATTHATATDPPGCPVRHRRRRTRSRVGVGLTAAAVLSAKDEWSGQPPADDLTLVLVDWERRFLQNEGVI